MSQNASDIHIAPRSETDIYFDWIVSCNNAYACEFWYFIKMSALVGNLDI
jgi:hypothetical protein